MADIINQSQYSVYPDLLLQSFMTWSSEQQLLTHSSWPSKSKGYVPLYLCYEPNGGAFVNWGWNLILSAPQTRNPEKSWWVEIVAKVDNARIRQLDLDLDVSPVPLPSHPNIHFTHFRDGDINNSSPEGSWWSWNQMRSPVGNRTCQVLSSVLRTITCVILFNPCNKVVHEKLFNLH